MRQPYELIKKYKEQGACMLATVVSGNAAGEKWLFCGGKPVPGQKPCALLTEHEEELRAITETRLLTSDEAKIFCECFGAAPQLVLCGAGTVGLALVPLAKTIGFSVTVLEDRQEYAKRAKALGADTVIAAPFEEGLQEIAGGAQTYFVVMTREHQYDLQCLSSILKKPGAYVGMMGSHRRTVILREQLKEQLREDKGALERLEKLHAPIGLAIQAQTPEEIAVSVAAELIKCKNEKRMTQGYDEKLLDALLSADQKASKAEENGDCVLAMIIERNGAAPRDIGTKMVVQKDGSIVGTIGGGLTEAEVIRRAKALMESDRKTEVYQDKLAGESGMLCGGTLQIYLERS